MQLEAGKYYMNRDGRKVGPMRVYDTDFFDCNDDNSEHFRKDGTGVGNQDIISEWTDAPKNPTNPIDLLKQAVHQYLMAGETRKAYEVLEFVIHMENDE